MPVATCPLGLTVTPHAPKGSRAAQTNKHIIKAAALLHRRGNGSFCSAGNCVSGGSSGSGGSEGRRGLSGTGLFLRDACAFGHILGNPHITAYHSTLAHCNTAKNGGPRVYSDIVA